MIFMHLGTIWCGNRIKNCDYCNLRTINFEGIMNELFLLSFLLMELQEYVAFSTIYFECQNFLVVL